MKNCFTIKRYGLIVLFAILGVCQVYGGEYYSKLTGTVNPTGAGTVYINDTMGENGQNSYSREAPTHTYTVRAEANDEYDFVNWTIENGNLTISDISNRETNVSFKANSTNQNNPTSGTIKANFGRKRYARVNTIVKPSDDAGTVSGGETKYNVSMGESADVTFSLTANPKPGYTFIGWSKSEDGSNPIASPNMNITITASSTNKDAPDEETYYAFFASQVLTPVIEIDKETGLTTITCATQDATIYYTTDGSNPTESSSKYNEPFKVTKGTVVKAMATKSGFINSAIASQKNEIAGPTGVSDGVVTLNDLEDHNWTYYSGVDRTVDGGNYNDNYAGKLYSPNPRNVKITYEANGGAVSIDESETSFVYFKTLEQGAKAGQYPYTVISNPFSKRPKGKGFGGWKIVSGGEYINGYDKGSTLPLDQEITFVNLPYPSTNCISAEIVLEATWVDAKITYLATVNNSNNNYTFNVTNDNTTYENNFLVINRSYSGILTLSQPVTIMMVEPDGTGTDYRDSYTFSGNITPNNTGVTKIEFAKWTTTSNINATGLNFTIGRGIQRPNGGSTLYGTNSDRNINHNFKIESGIWKNFYAIGSSGPSNNMTKQNIIFGNDYDKAKNNNDNLILTNSFLLLDKNATVGQDKLVVTVKSGKITRDLDHNTAGASGNCCYLWDNGGDGNGSRELIVEGGEMWHIAGGYDKNNSESSTNLKIRVKGGTIHGSIYGGAAKYDTKGYKQFIFTGGTVKGWIAGGSNGYLATGESSLNGTVTGRSYVYVGGRTQVSSDNSTTAIDMSVGGNVYGAGCGNTTVNNSGRVTNQTNVVIADECYVQRGVYGGGAYGSSPGTANVYITGNAHVGGVYENTFDVYGGVYGGARAKGGGSTNIYMTGGYVEHGVYGGSNLTGTISNNVTMQINGGQVGTSGTPANIHGGGYGQATQVSGNVEVTLGTEKQATGGGTVYGDVYGGSALGTVNSGANDHTYVTMHKGTINGSLYGGGLGSTDVAANVNGPVKVEVHGGSVKKTSAAGSGGVYGANNIYGAPQRSVTVDIYGTDPAPAEGQYALHAVYGGGNQADYTYGNGYPKVTVHYCNNSIEYVYGGGNAAAVAATDVTIWGGDVIGNVFGGGNGESGTAADVNGNVDLKIYGGTILNVFGGSNSKGKIGDNVNVKVNSQGEGGKAPCPMIIDNVYGGGNEADMDGSPNIVLGCINYLKEVYGGSRNADVGSDINITITSGHFDRVFGGNNLGGAIKGSITLNIEETGCNPITIGEVYGGGNKAAYSVYGYEANGKPKETGEKLYSDPVVNLRSFTSIGRVFGGGLGEEAVMVGSPTVNINEVKGVNADNTEWTYLGKTIEYADGSSITLPTHSAGAIGAIQTVFGGGNAAKVIGNTHVNIGTLKSVIFKTPETNNDGTPTTEQERTRQVEGADIRENVYGGGNKADVTGKTNVTIGK